MFSVEAPELEEKAPRYYWRGYAYDLYQNNNWFATEATVSEFSPSDTRNHRP